MKKDGTYIVKQWDDASSEFDLDGIILELVKSTNNHGEYEVVQWTEEELQEMFSQMSDNWSDQETGTSQDSTTDTAIQAINKKKADLKYEIENI